MNKTIWMCWFQGWDDVPDVVGLCLESWKYHNPDWNIVLLDKENITDYIDISHILPASAINQLPAAYSDVLRIALLREYGGVWADATCFCNKPLDHWLSETVDDSWCYYRQESAIASWFICANKGSYIIEQWYNSVVSYWKERLSDNDRMKGEYRWVHFLFVELLDSDEKFKQIYSSWIKKDATSFSRGCSPPPTKEFPYGSRGLSALFFTPYPKYLNETLTPTVKDRIDSKVDEMYKLTHHLDIDWLKENTSIKYLITTIDIDLIIE